MLSTYPQWLLFIIFLLFGFLSGFFVGINKAVYILTNKKNIIQIILDSLSCLYISTLYLIACNLLNFGEHRLFLIIGYLLGLFIERKTIGKLFAKLYFSLYNLIVLKLKIVSKSKLGTIIRR